MRVMNKRMFLILSCVAAFSVSGCSSKECQVSFSENYDGGLTNTDTVVKSGKKVVEPETPEREGYNFIGWFEDEMLVKKWDFSKDKVKDNLTLYAGWDKTSDMEIETNVADKDFSSLKTPGSQEMAYEYQTFFLPSIDGINQPYVGDTMPFYEDGVYYIYYLKDGGDSYNHSVYLATTRDFVSYEEQDTPVLESNRSGGQDGWIGTGSVVKIKDTYYFFYTGHASSNMEYNEKVMVAQSKDLRSFEKVSGWEITPDSSLGQKLDFRDPQAYFDENTGKITLTITASQSGKARILKYTLDADLSNIQYDGIIYTDPIGEVYNLECSDTFQIGDKYYITYSAQDDTLWYAMSDTAYGPYSEPKRLDGKLFYAAKHVEADGNYYMVGWTRRSESPSSTAEVAGWGGNLTVQQIEQLEDGSLVLKMVDQIADAYQVRRELAIEESYSSLQAASLFNFQPVFKTYESYKIDGTMKFSGTGQFGLAFEYGKDEKDYKMILIDPRSESIKLAFDGGDTVITEIPLKLEPNEDYEFSYVQEGSVGIFYIDKKVALTVRLYGVTGKNIHLFAENNTVLLSSLREYTK